MLPRDARLLLLSLFFDSLPIGTLLVFFPLYMHDIGTKAVMIGGLFTGAGIGSSLLLMAIGPLADRFGRRLFLLIGTCVPAFGFLIFMLTTNTAWLVVASTLGGVGFSGGLGGGMVTATFNPMLAGMVEPRHRTAALSFAECAWVASIGFGALLAGVPSVLARSHVMSLVVADRALFLVCLISTLAATVLLLPVVDSHDVEKRRATGVHTAPRARQRIPFTLTWRLAVFFTLQGAGLGLVVQLLPLWFALRFDTTAASIAPWFSAAQFVGFPFLLVVPWLARRIGVARVIVLVALSSTLLLAGVPLMPALPLAAMFYIARSALVSMQWPAQHSFLQGAVEPRLRATVTSITLGCWSTANAVMPLLSGYLFDRGLLSLPLFLGTGCYAAGALWFAFALRRIPLPEERLEHMPLEAAEHMVAPAT